MRRASRGWRWQQYVRWGLLAGVVILGCHRSHADTREAPVAVVPAVHDVAPSSGKPNSSRIPRDAARFEIEVVSDSTARFKPREVNWIRPGMTAYVVDPTNRDALVARSRVLSVWNDMAVAVVTSQVTRVTTRHVVLMTPPPVSWWKARRFWMGTVVGALFGGSIGVLATP